MNIDNVCWELDYPHADTQWPHAPEMVMKYLADVPDDEIDDQLENVSGWGVVDNGAYASEDERQVWSRLFEA